MCGMRFDGDFLVEIFEIYRVVVCFLARGLRNAWPATGIENPEPRNSSKKTLKSPPPGPDPKFIKKTQRILKIPENYFFSGFFVFFEFFLRSPGLGPGGEIFFLFFSGMSGSEVFDPCRWPGGSQCARATPIFSKKESATENLRCEISASNQVPESLPELLRG